MMTSPLQAELKDITMPDNLFSPEQPIVVFLASEYFFIFITVKIYKTSQRNKGNQQSFLTDINPHDPLSWIISSGKDYPRIVTLALVQIMDSLIRCSHPVFQVPGEADFGPLLEDNLLELLEIGQRQM